LNSIGPSRRMFSLPIPASLVSLMDGDQPVDILYKK
jgi:hypothetical protein